LHDDDDLDDDEHDLYDDDPYDDDPYDDDPYDDDLEVSIVCMHLLVVHTCIRAVTNKC